MKKFLSAVFEQLGRYNDVVNVYTKATAAAPDHALAHVNWGIQLANDGQFEAAIEKFKQAADISPERDACYSNWGVALAKQGDLNEAITLFEKAVTLAPENINNYLLWGAALVESGDYTQAEEKYKRAIQIAPHNPEPYVNWGIALTRAEQYDQAVKQFQRAVMVRRYQPQVYFLWGAVLAELDQYEAAIEKFQLTLRLEPNHPDAHYFLSVCQNRLGQYEAALAAACLALSHKPNQAEVHLNMGDILANLGRYEAAIANYEQAIALSDTLAEAYKSWGDALVCQRLFDQAEAKFLQAESINSDVDDLYRAWSNSKMQQKQYKEALPLLEKAHLADPHDHHIIVQWSLALIKTGHPQTALDKLFEVDAQDSWNPRVHYLLGTHYLSEDQWDPAIDHLQKALQHQPNFEDAAINLALAYAKKQQFDEAIRTLRPVLRQSPDSAKINFFYGNIQMQSGDEVDGVKKLEKALSLDPTYIEPYLLLAERALKNQHPQTALTLLTDAKAHHPEHPVLNLLLAVAILKRHLTSDPEALQHQPITQVAPDALTALHHAQTAYEKTDAVPLECHALTMVVNGLCQGPDTLRHQGDTLIHAATTDEEKAQYHFYLAQGLALLSLSDEQQDHIQQAKALSPEIFSMINPALTLVL